ncbi:hypothetical protein [Lysinibacillus sp. FJAT-14745]|nr:hypothetical protein [Lysinibacillus sp. FJAT-14745]
MRKVRLLAVFFLEKKLYADFAAFFLHSARQESAQLERKLTTRYGAELFI